MKKNILLLVTFIGFLMFFSSCVDDQFNDLAVNPLDPASDKIPIEIVQITHTTASGGGYLMHIKYKVILENLPDTNSLPDIALFRGGKYKNTKAFTTTTGTIDDVQELLSGTYSYEVAFDVHGNYSKRSLPMTIVCP